MKRSAATTQLPAPDIQGVFSLFRCKKIRVFAASGPGALHHTMIIFATA
jgi:hypothetical protein